MSYEIDFNRLAIRFELSKALVILKSRYDIDERDAMFYSYLYRDTTLVLAQIGNNRVFDMDNKISRDWVVVTLSTSPMIEIVEIARDVERGGIRLNGRHTQPEGYIRTYRQLIETAPPSFWFLNHEFPDGLSFYLNTANDAEVKQRWNRHPHTRSLLDSGSLIQEANTGRWLLNIPFIDEANQLLAVAWYFAVIGEQTRPSLKRNLFDRALDVICKARKLGVYTQKQSA